MPNPIKYSTGSETDALKKGNFYIGTGSVGKGPSDVTGYYQGPSPVSGGYVIYMNKDGAPGNLSYHSAANDAELISFTNNLAGQSYTGVQQCFDYYYGQTDKVLVNQDYPADYPYIVMDGLVLNLDAGITQSYPGSGTVWTDVNGLGPKNNGTLTNGPTFNSANGGSIVFDGVDDYINTPVSRNTTTNQNYTIIVIFKINSFTSGDMRIFGAVTGPTGQLTVGWDTSTLRLWVQSSWNNTSFTSLTNTIYHLTMVHEGTDNKIYVNGVFNSNVSNKTSYFDNLGFGQPFVLEYGSYFNGNIYTSQVYNRALSAAEVLQNYNAQKGRFGL